jgi:cobalt/nickel transport system permease protein
LSSSSCWCSSSGACSPAGGRAGPDLDLDRYLARESAVHDLDARLKFVLTVGFIVSISLLPTGSFAALGIAWLGLAGLSALARLGPFRLTRSAFFALPFMLAALPLVFTRPGDPLGTLELGPLVLTISGQGLREFATIALKSWVSVQAALLLSFTTPFPDLVVALRRLRLPRLLVAIIGFMYRYLAVLTGEAGRLNRARVSRSAVVEGRGGGSLRWRAGVVGGMVGTLFLRSYERSERVYAAMQARGFDGEFRTLGGRALATTDWAAFVAVAAAIVALAVAGQLVLPRS